MKPPRMDAPAPPRAADDPCYVPAEELLVAFRLPEEDRLETLRTRVAESGCRLFRPEAGGTRTRVLAGRPEALGRLRNLLLTEEPLRFLRELLEERLGLQAAHVEASRLSAEEQRRDDVAEEIPVPEGTTLRVSREFQFDAAHNLPRYNGKCERLHGHTFRVQVTVEAPLDTWSGMAFDFHDLKKIVNSRVVEVLDHSYINEVVCNPSAEYLAIWIWDRLSDLPLHEIRVWETPTCCVTYQGPPRRRG